MAFVNYCIKILRSNGWKIVDTPTPTRLVIEKPGKPVHVMFKPPQQSGITTTRIDWSEQNNWKGLPLAVITYSEVELELSTFASEAGITLVTYLNIFRLEQLIEKR